LVGSKAQKLKMVVMQMAQKRKSAKWSRLKLQAASGDGEFFLLFFLTMILQLLLGDQAVVLAFLPIVLVAVSESGCLGDACRP